MSSDVDLHLPSSLFSCLKMLTLSVKFTIATQSCKMQFIFLQLGLVHESWVSAAAGKLPTPGSSDDQMQHGQKTQSKTNKKQTNQQQPTWLVLWFILSSRRISVRPRIVRFSLREAWISRWEASVQCVLFCARCFASMNCLPPFAVTVPEVSTCTLVRGHVLCVLVRTTKTP